MLDIKDKKIIRALRSDGRVRLEELSKITSIPISTVHQRLHKLMQESIRCLPLISYKQLPISVHAIILIKTDRREKIREALTNHIHVNSLISTQNGAQYIAECMFPTYASYAAFIQELEHYGEIQAHPVTQIVKKEEALIV